jgi:hypothetical protein
MTTNKQMCEKWKVKGTHKKKSVISINYCTGVLSFLQFTKIKKLYLRRTIIADAK